MLENFLILINKDLENLSQNDLKKLNYLLEKSKRSIYKLANVEEEKIDKNLEDIIVELAVYRYSILGLEATKSESYNGTAFSYMLDIPEHIKTQITPYKRRLRVL